MQRNNINTIPIAEQHAIKQWYRHTLVIISGTFVLLTVITIVQLYQTTTLSKICKPSAHITNTAAIKKKYESITAELKKTEQQSALQEKGMQLLTQYRAALSTHAENTLLSPVATLHLKSSGITAEYTLQSPQMINTYMDALKETKLFTEIFFNSCTRSQHPASMYTCTIQAEWANSTSF